MQHVLHVMEYTCTPTYVMYVLYIDMHICSHIHTQRRQAHLYINAYNLVKHLYKQVQRFWHFCFFYISITVLVTNIQAILFCFVFYNFFFLNM